MSTNGARLEEAWEHFVESRRIPEHGLREEVRAAWSRGPVPGVQPDEVTRLPADQLAERLGREGPLIDASGVQLAALSMASGSERHAGALADRHGIVLYMTGDRETLAEHSLPAPGTVLTEQIAGANAIGTALATRRDCELAGREQFLRCLHPFRSEGAPIRGPDGEIVGAIALSIDINASRPRARDVLVCAARGIEAELVRGRLEADIKRLLAAGDDVEALERLRQDVTQLQAAARLGVERAARATGRGEDALGVLRSATELLDRFRERSIYWRALASNERSAPHPFSLEWKLGRILDLLETDLTIRGVTTTVARSANVMLLADGHLVVRELFDGLRAALALAKKGDVLRIGFDAGQSTVTLETSKGAGVHVPLTLTAVMEPAAMPRGARDIHA